MKNFQRSVIVALALTLLAFMSNQACAAPDGTTKIQGTINRLDQYKIVVSVDDKDYILGLDSTRTKIVGRPRVGKQATVWYKKDAKGTLYAMRIEVPESAGNPNANAADPTTATLTGTLSQVSNDRITLRANGQQYKLMLDNKRTKVTGRMAVSKPATVTYKKYKGNLWAMTVVVPENKANPNANADDPEKGTLVGTFTQVADDRITIRANGKEYKVMLDGKKTEFLHHPVVSKNGTIWYRKYKGNLWAVKVDVEVSGEDKDKQ